MPQQISFLLGNCLQILPTLQQRFSLAIVDPPYFVLNQKNITGLTRTNGTKRMGIILDTEFDHFPDYESYNTFTLDWVKALCSCMEPDATIYCFCAHQYITDFIDCFAFCGFAYKSHLIWVKQNPMLHVRLTNWISATESILMFTRGNPVFHFTNQSDMKNYFITPLLNGKERLFALGWNQHNNALHPCQKPESVIRKLLEASSNKGDWVLDCFGGVATVLAVAQTTERNAVGIEVNEIYWKAGMERLKQSKVVGKKLGEY